MRHRQWTGTSFDATVGGPLQIRWKLAVVLVLLESYILCKDRQAQDPQNVHQFSTEQMFYMCFMLSLIGTPMRFN